MNILLRRAGLVVWLFVFSASSVAYAQRSNRPLVCKSATLAALKPMPQLSYECDDQLKAWDEKILKLPARVSAIKTLESELSSFTDLAACDFTGKTGTLTDRKSTRLNSSH